MLLVDDDFPLEIPHDFPHTPLDNPPADDVDKGEAESSKDALAVTSVASVSRGVRG